jgi:SAM-dependent methyltransferase
MAGKPKMINSSRVHLRREMTRFAKGTRKGMVVLDAGAGKSPYRKLFKHAQYEAADFAQLSTKYAPLDYVCDLSSIPVEDGRFDRIVFNQVLEHIPDPAVVLTELYRVLKPGGRLFCSVPLFYAEHQQPYDFYRYTQFALRRLFENAGFTIVRIDWLEGYFGTVSYQFHQMYNSLPASLSEVRALGLGKRAVVVAPTILATRAVAGKLRLYYAKLDIASKQSDRGMPKNYVVVVKKPLSTPSE